MPVDPGSAPPPVPTSTGDADTTPVPTVAATQDEVTSEPKPKRTRRSSKTRTTGKSQKSAKAKKSGKSSQGGCCGVIGLVILLIGVVFVGAVLRDELFPPDDPFPTSVDRTAQSGFVDIDVSEDEPVIEIESIVLQGQVRLPEDSSLEPGELSILSNDGLVPPAEDGGFSLPALRGPESTTLVLALNQAGNPVLLRATRGAGTLGSGELSADSTVEALALFDMAVLELPPSVQEDAAHMLALAPSYGVLSDAVYQAILTDPTGPLDADAHPEVYEAAAQVTAEVLSLLEGVGAVEGDRLGWLTAGRAEAAAPETAEAAGYVFVSDDAEHKLPDVVLNNHTFAYYMATVRGGKFADDAAPVLMRRSKPYNVVRFQMPMPVVGTSTTVRPGDGSLEFVFNKDTQLTAFDLSMTVISNILGLPATQAGGIQEQLRIFMAASKECQTAIADLAAMSRMKGLTPGEAAQELAKFVGVHGTTIAFTALSLHGHIAADQAGKVYVGKVAQIIGRKAFFAITAGYAGVDTTGMAWSLSNAPDSYTEVGVQKDGVYPAITLEIDPPGIENAVPGQGYGLVAKASRIPDNVRDVEFFWDYTDGGSDEIISQPEAGMAVVAVKHAFDQDHEVRVYLTDMATGTRLAGASMWVRVDTGVMPTEEIPAEPPAVADPVEESESEDPINGIWQATLTCTSSSDPDEVGHTVAGPMRISTGNGGISLAADDGSGGWVSYGADSDLERSGSHYSFEIVDAWHAEGGLESMHHAYELDMETPNSLVGRMTEEFRKNRDGGHDILSEATYDVSFSR